MHPAQDINKIDFPYFTSLRFINDKKEGIAKSQMYTGELVLNLFYWSKLIPEHKFYVLAHEEGHVFYDTNDELEADSHASKRYLKAGLPIGKSITALSEHLDRNKPVHAARAWAQYQRALQYDWEHNKNKKAYRRHYDNANDVKIKLLNNGFK